MLDFGNQLDLLRDGRLNIALDEDNTLDWAIHQIKVSKDALAEDEIGARRTSGLGKKSASNVK